jgi:hypothetical protein
VNFKAAKRRYDNERRLPAEYLEQPKSCFWTWPWGHRWEYRKEEYGPVMRCAICGRWRAVNPD